MNEIQTRIQALQERGWTLAAIADEMGVTVNAVEKWKAGDRRPENEKLTLDAMERLVVRKRIPKKRRIVPGSRQSS